MHIFVCPTLPPKEMLHSFSELWWYFGSFDTNCTSCQNAENFNFYFLQRINFWKGNEESLPWRTLFGIPWKLNSTLNLNDFYIWQIYFYIFAHFENDEHHLRSIRFHQLTLAPILSFLCIFSNISIKIFFSHFLVNYVFFFFFGYTFLSLRFVEYIRM
jgi:hypothetical protein